MFIRSLLGLTVAAALGWSAWWWIASTAQRGGIETWFSERRAAGWQAEYAALDVAGFPNRLDAELTELALADPASGWAWSAPRLAIFQLVYDPRHLIVQWPEEQRIAAPGAKAVIRAEVMRASLAIDDPAALSLARNSVEILRGAAAAEAGWTASVDRYNHHILNLPEDAGPANAYAFRIDAEGIRPPDFIRRLADPAGALPPAIRLAMADGKAAFDRPLDRFAIEGVKPQLTQLSLKEAVAEWGPLRLALSGAVAADEDGYAEGAFDISARNWEEMLEAATAAGVMPSRLADALKLGLGFLARLGGDPRDISAELTFQDGFVKLGPVPIGPAPRLVR